MEATGVVSSVESFSLPESPVIVINAADVIIGYQKKLDRSIQVYNNRLEKLSSPYFIRTSHSSNGYEYPGRYFYKHVWNEEKGRMERVYIGITVPDDDDVPDGGFPKAPVNVLEGFEYKIFHHDVICSYMMYEQFSTFFMPHGFTVLRLKR